MVSILTTVIGSGGEVFPSFYIFRSLCDFRAKEILLLFLPEYFAVLKFLLHLTHTNFVEPVKHNLTL